MQHFREKGWKMPRGLPISARQLCPVPCLLLADDSLISQIFHHTQPIETVAHQVSVLFRHFPAF